MKNMDSPLAYNLRFLIENKAISETHLSRKTGINQPVINRMTSGETVNPRIETLLPIARYFSVTVDQLMGLEAIPNTEQESTPITRIPFYTLQDIHNWPNPPKELAHTYAEVPKKPDGAYCCIQLIDTTMEPYYPKHATVILNTQSHAHDQDLVVVHQPKQQHSIFRQLLFDGSMRYLKPFNTNFPIITLETSYRIIGVCVMAHIHTQPLK